MNESVRYRCGFCGKLNISRSRESHDIRNFAHLYFSRAFAHKGARAARKIDTRCALREGGIRGCLQRAQRAGERATHRALFTTRKTLKGQGKLYYT